jgi:hypothetical protein
MLRKLAMTLLLFAFPICAVGAQPTSVENLGSGTMSCGTWTAERSNHQVAAQYSQEWVLGYLTEDENWLSTKENKSLSFSTDSAGIFGWIDNYCKANPMVALAVATNALIDTNALFSVYTPSN